MPTCRHCGCVVVSRGEAETQRVLCGGCGAVYEIVVTEVAPPRKTGRVVQPSRFVPVKRAG